MANIVFMLDYQGKNLQIGGASNHINLLAPRVKRAGFDVRIAMPVSPRTSTLYSSLESASVTVDVVDTSPQAGNALRRLHTAFRYFLARRPDVVHFVMPWWNACEHGIMGAWLARVPVRVATYHAVPEAIDPQVFRGVSGLARRQRHRFTRGCIDKAVSVCAAISQRLVANGLYTSERVVVIRNGVDTKSLSSANSGVDYRRKWSVGESRFLITVIGYLEEIKGHHYLLEALPAIVQRHTNVLVAFVGDGVLRASLEAQAHAKNLADHVVFTGWQSDVSSILAASDLLVMPSLSEGLPLAVLEAMAAGLPVVATNVGGIPEAVIDGQTGLLVEPGSAAGLQEAIVELLHDHERATAMGKAGQARAKSDFDVVRMVGETCDLYRSLL